MGVEAVDRHDTSPGKGGREHVSAAADRSNEGSGKGARRILGDGGPQPAGQERGRRGKTGRGRGGGQGTQEGRERPLPSYPAKTAAASRPSWSTEAWRWASCALPSCKAFPPARKCVSSVCEGGREFEEVRRAKERGAKVEKGRWGDDPQALPRGHKQTARAPRCGTGMKWPGVIP